jgi:hypothetical protein
VCTSSPPGFPAEGKMFNHIAKKTDKKDGQATKTINKRLSNQSSDTNAGAPA